MKRVYILGLKNREHLSSLYQAMAKFKIDSRNLISSLKENKPFIVDIDESNYNAFIDDIKDFTEFRVENIGNIDKYTDINRWSVCSILILDIFTIVAMLETIFKNIYIQDFLTNFVYNSTLVNIITISIKIFVGFIMLKGLIEMLKTTLWGYIFKVNFNGDLRNLILTMFVPIVGFYLINIGIGGVYRSFGMFLIIFFIVSILIGFENLNLTFKRKSMDY